MSIQQNIGARLTAYMKNKNLSQHEMARLLGISQASLHYYATGKRAPSAAVITKIANILDCGFGELLRTEN